MLSSIFTSKIQSFGYSGLPFSNPTSWTLLPILVFPTPPRPPVHQFSESRRHSIPPSVWLKLLMLFLDLRPKDQECAQRFMMTDVEVKVSVLNDEEAWRLFTKRAGEVASLELIFNHLQNYDSLEGKNIKACFLYCALYPEDFLIEVSELVRGRMAEGLFDEQQNFEEAINNGIVVVETLKDSCLLEDGASEGSVKIIFTDACS
ncbi:hypothetical protein TIFTF001_038401 [Ficus carica]|uniref:Uncharacterized protein n=1 Tax=Ficus carica TaxID=3494 RepID=A0AA88JEK1_FICCA|nr:hypothetical protein TIFTF001_038401 [Ficus carica]